MKLWRLNVSWQPPAISDEQHLARLYRNLRRFGVPGSAAKVTIDDLRGDMVEAGSLAALTGADLDRFAADVAREHGRAPVPGRHWLIVPLMAAPMLLVAFLTYVFVAGGGPAIGLDYHKVQFIEHETVQFDGGGRTTEVESSFDEWLPLVAYFAGTALGVGGGFGLAALGLLIARDRCIGPTLRRCLVTLPLGGVIGVLTAVGIGASTNYSDAPHVILVEVFAVCVFGGLAIVVAREWARRLPRRNVSRAQTAVLPRLV